MSETLASPEIVISISWLILALVSIFGVPWLLAWFIIFMFRRAYDGVFTPDQKAFFPSKEEGEKCIHGAAVLKEVWQVRLCGVPLVKLQKLKSVTDLSGTDFSRMRSELERRGF